MKQAGKYDSALKEKISLVFEVVCNTQETPSPAYAPKCLRKSDFYKFYLHITNQRGIF